VFIKAEAPNATQLGVLIVCYGFFSYVFNRYPGSMQAIRGSGLIAPVFGS
jgi:hypothetical protein